MLKTKLKRINSAVTLKNGAWALKIELLNVWKYESLIKAKIFNKNRNRKKSNTTSTNSLNKEATVANQLKCPKKKKKGADRAFLSSK